MKVTNAITESILKLSDKDSAIITHSVQNEKYILKELNSRTIPQLQELFYSLIPNKFPSSEYFQDLIKRSMQSRLKSTLNISPELEVEELFCDVECAMEFLKSKEEHTKET